MPEAHALCTHHPVDHRAAGLARTEAMPQILLGRDHETRLMVLVKRTQAHQVLAVLLQLHAGCLREALHAHFALKPLELVICDSGHPKGLQSQRSSSSKSS